MYTFWVPSNSNALATGSLGNSKLCEISEVEWFHTNAAHFIAETNQVVQLHSGFFCRYKASLPLYFVDVTTLRQAI